MRSTAIIPLFAWFAFLGSSVLTYAEQPQLEKIFNGRDFTGWKVPQDNIWWTLHDGVLTAKSGPDKKGSTFWTTEKYEDFVIEFDFRIGQLLGQFQQGKDNGLLALSIKIAGLLFAERRIAQSGNRHVRYRQCPRYHNAWA